MRVALQFLTILPVRAPDVALGRAAVWFPLAGVLLGIAAAAATQVPLFGPLLALVLLAVLTGGLHEDGLADVCDALRGHRTRERMLAILDDSRIGAHGALALVFSVLFRWQALVHLQGDAWLRLPAACGISRAAMVLLARVSRPAGSGLGAQFVKTVPGTAAFLVAAQVLALAALASWPASWLAGAVLVGVNAIAIVALRWWFHARLGGVNGDCLGFMCQLSEALSLVVLACL